MHRILFVSERFVFVFVTVEAHVVVDVYADGFRTERNRVTSPKLKAINVHDYVHVNVDGYEKNNLRESFQ
jgi:hypothetical protein